MPLIEELDTTIQSVYFSADYLSQRSPGPHLKVIIDDFLAYHHLRQKSTDPSFGEALEEFGSFGFGWERAVTHALNALNTFGAETDLLLASPPPSADVRRVYESVFAAAFNEAARERDSAIIKLGEITLDDIHCTADGYNKRARCPEEWKCSWGSAAQGIREDWMMQMCGYAAAWGFDRYTLRALYVNGYYEKGAMGRPVARGWMVRWSRAELAENWSLIVEHKAVMEAEGRL